MIHNFNYNKIVNDHVCSCDTPFISKSWSDYLYVCPNKCLEYFYLTSIQFKYLFYTIAIHLHSESSGNIYVFYGNKEICCWPYSSPDQLNDIINNLDKYFLLI